MSKKIVIAIYAHPEGYPPTLNCVSELSRVFDSILLIGRNVVVPTWKYPNNCTTFFSGNYINIRSSEHASTLRKIGFFIKFILVFHKTVKKEKPDVILVYDPMALFAYQLIRVFILIKPLLWYHNHDVFEEDKVRKYSIQWWAGKYESRFFGTIDIFSLPANERKRHFPLNDFNGKYFFLPNFPSIDFFGKFYKQREIGNEVKLIFQGAIAEGHGLEEISRILGQPILGKTLHLIIKGWIRDFVFKSKLEDITVASNCKGNLEFVGYGPYKDLPVLTSDCHIGIGIHSQNTELHTSLGKASNKIYEYASVGLPIIVFDNPHYREHLEKYIWVFFTDLSEASLQRCISDIIKDYDKLSRQAYSDFQSQLNFGLNFQSVIKYLEGIFLLDTHK